MESKSSSEGLLRQRKQRSYGSSLSAERGEVSLKKAADEPFVSRHTSVYFLVAPPGGHRPALSARSSWHFDARRTRGDIAEANYGESLGTT